MRKARNLTVEIDGTKLKDIFKARGLNLGDVSRDCGYDGSYFSHVCRQNKITKPASVLLQDRYKIYLDDYEPTKPEPEIVTSGVYTQYRGRVYNIGRYSKEITPDYLFSGI